jgi:hypothetical protein
MLTAGPVGADSVFRTDMRGMGGLDMRITATSGQAAFGSPPRRSGWR